MIDEPRAVALFAALLLAGCSSYSAPPPMVQTPNVSIQAGPSAAPPPGTPASSSATAACAGITAQQGGGTAYLNCVDRRE